MTDDEQRLYDLFKVIQGRVQDVLHGLKDGREDALADGLEALRDIEGEIIEYRDGA